MAAIFACVVLLFVGLFLAGTSRLSPDSSAMVASPDDLEMTANPAPPPPHQNLLPDLDDQVAAAIETPANPDERAPNEPATDPAESEVEEPAPVVITSLPVRMRIPALSLDYEVVSMGADAVGTMQIFPAREIISWFDRSAIPGNEGNGILGGHNTWRGTRSRLFTLDELQIGDEMEIVYDDETSLVFRLESVFVYPLSTAPAHLIMNTRGEARVTLITCKPPYNPSIGTSDNTIVAIFKEESVFEIPDPPIMPFPLRGSEPEEPDNSELLDNPYYLYMPVFMES